MSNQRKTANARRGGSSTRQEDVIVNLGSGPYSRGHKLPKLYYNADTHETNFILFRTKLREVVPAMFDGLAAHLFKDNKVADGEELVKPKERLIKTDDQGTPVKKESTGEYEMVANQVFKAELEDYKRRSVRVDAEAQKLKGQLANIWIFLIDLLTPSSIDRLSDQDSYLDIELEQDPVKLWNLIVLTHLDKADVDTVARLVTANNNLFSMVQEPGEEIIGYLRRFKESHERLLAAEPEKFFEYLPLISVRLFFANLEPRYAEYQLDVLNGIKLRGEKWPETITQVAKEARQFLVRKSKVSEKNTGLSQTGTILKATGGEKTVKAAPKGGCHHCGEAHFLSECPTHDPKAHGTYGVKLRLNSKDGEGNTTSTKRGRGGRTKGTEKKNESAHLAEDAEEEELYLSYVSHFDDKDAVGASTETYDLEDNMGHEDSLFMIEDLPIEENEDLPIEENEARVGRAVTRGRGRRHRNVRFVTGRNGVRSIRSGIAPSDTGVRTRSSGPIGIPIPAENIARFRDATYEAALREHLLREHPIGNRPVMTTEMTYKPVAPSSRDSQGNAIMDREVMSRGTHACHVYYLGRAAITKPTYRVPLGTARPY